ncbi:uncharacterized protein LOC111377145 [Olea europaea var. sylvestris]|uniref:uncharacterized protein LOC111377145 n=1 Tax=Olea europaea var. sylvestris TaxID=158386 RepID=UPI000C1D0C15|nr:uncharacterized protein LOC111377145 [Olea europaea var. sylvestris]
MEQPPWFVAQGKYRKVCHLKKSLYGLKQSSHAWFRADCAGLSSLKLSTYQISHKRLGPTKIFSGNRSNKIQKRGFLISTKYRRLIGKLNYLTVTRPDIAHAVSVIFCYLKRASGLGIVYNNHGHTCIEGLIDADWAGSKINRRYTTGYCVFVGENLVSWRSKKQNVVFRSSAKSEYKAMA